MCRRIAVSADLHCGRRERLHRDAGEGVEYLQYAFQAALDEEGPCVYQVLDIDGRRQGGEIGMAVARS